MKQRTLHYLLILAMVGIGLAGCRSDVKLNDVSVDSKLTAKLGLPIGEISFTFDSILSQIGFGEGTRVYIDSIDSVLVLAIDKHYDNEFHSIELTDYTGTVESSKPVKEVMPGVTMIPAGTKEEVPFNMDINFNGVNDDLSDERIDSMVIERAGFTTKVTNNFGLTKDDIDSVVMVLGPQFRRAKGTRQALPNFDFNKNIKIELDNFTLVMMKDETKAPADDNVVNKANIQFVIYLNYHPDGNPFTDQIIIYDNSAFNFSFKVEMMTYSALYGFFEPGKDTEDIDSVDVPIDVPGGEPVVLAAKDPEITLEFTYAMSMPLAVDIRGIKALHSDGTETPALWKGQPTKLYPLDVVLPINAPLDATVKDYITLNKDKDRGEIDRFFKKEVKYLWYDYKLDVDRNKMASIPMPQFRMTHNTKFSLDFHFKMPFDFDKEFKLAYSDTIPDINLQSLALDSLVNMAGGIVDSIESAKLHLYLIINNEIPIAFTLEASMLDENNQPIDIEGLRKKIEVKPAKMAGKGSVTPAEQFVHDVTVTKDEFDKLAQAKSLRVHATLGDEKNPSSFLSNKKLSIKAGITADIQAVINLSLNQQNNQ